MRTHIAWHMHVMRLWAVGAIDDERGVCLRDRPTQCLLPDVLQTCCHHQTFVVTCPVTSAHFGTVQGEDLIKCRDSKLDVSRFCRDPGAAAVDAVPRHCVRRCGVVTELTPQLRSTVGNSTRVVGRPVSHVQTV